MDTRLIGRTRHQAVERVDFAYQMALADTADGRIAGHNAYRLPAVGEQERGCAATRRRRRRLTPGMSPTDDYDVEPLVHHVVPLLANAELTKNGIQNILDADFPGQASQSAHGQS
ncbi:hypothetical protein AA23498_1414 [Acetobacter nitrogenifigens DSM 23921 = NBRC 105050]|uniref:Uncharacterized protein n=1 Tax=Acetobacter nitrogenifigens DSM 23921 = NBRC 105050 TaxID=1120919 RepID=A0A511XEH7_9PROT|nr:hypothetical protein AA23498_1414 [Acetobacter nitrogenifigens DSM 23921 = NBRC 105050]GEN61301.1 hypothetical protein ANI02nite_31850 [Acetobacter nitrogenifigens DSM 23921 = NBRC 105050]